MVPVSIWPWCLKFAASTLHFCCVNGKICGMSALKHKRAKTTYLHDLGTRLFWGTRATNFFIYTTKMEGAGPQILDTGAKFKRVPWQKSCRVNRAINTQVQMLKSLNSLLIQQFTVSTGSILTMVLCRNFLLMHICFQDAFFKITHPPPK